jgi:hypothetical protein
MICWLAREEDGKLYMFRDEPKLLIIDADTSDGHWTGHCTFEWDKSQGCIELHPNTYLKVLKGTKHKVECKVHLI